MARKDIKEIIASAIGQRLPTEAAATEVVEKLYRDEIKQQVAAALKGNGTWNSPSFVQEVVRNEIRQQLKVLIKDGSAI